MQQLSGSYNFYARGCDVFTCKNALYTLIQYYAHCGQQFTTKIWPHANQAMVTNNLPVIIKVVLIEGNLYSIFSY